jgi:hypothetical protein
MLSHLAPAVSIRALPAPGNPPAPTVIKMIENQVATEIH